MDAEVIANRLIVQCTKIGLSLTKILGQGYDACSTVAGKVDGIQAKKIPKAAFVNCTAYRLSLVANDQRSVMQLGQSRQLSCFFYPRELQHIQPGTKINNIPYIRIFTNHFENIYKQLGILAAIASGKNS